MPTHVDCLIEAGSERVFASAAAWPGWCRAGRDEGAALEALGVCGGRYASAMKASGVRFSIPGRGDPFRVIERVAGNATTDFGAPDGVYGADDETISAREWARFRRVLDACWAAFDGAAAAADGVELQKGPRGGGRGLDAIVAHVVGAEAGYLRMLTGATVTVDEADPWGARGPERAALLEGLDRAEVGDLPERGPRGGKRWKPRRFLRRTAWHVLDHAWEIEDRRDP
jgi:hypothetical protein